MDKLIHLQSKALIVSGPKVGKKEEPITEYEEEQLAIMVKRNTTANIDSRSKRGAKSIKWKALALDWGYQCTAETEKQQATRLFPRTEAVLKSHWQLLKKKENDALERGAVVAFFASAPASAAASASASASASTSTASSAASAFSAASASTSATSIASSIFSAASTSIVIEPGQSGMQSGHGALSDMHTKAEVAASAVSSAVSANNSHGGGGSGSSGSGSGSGGGGNGSGGSSNGMRDHLRTAISTAARTLGPLFGAQCNTTPPPPPAFAPTLMQPPPQPPPPPSSQTSFASPSPSFSSSSTSATATITAAARTERRETYHWLAEETKKYLEICAAHGARLTYKQFVAEWPAHFQPKTKEQFYNKNRTVKDAAAKKVKSEVKMNVKVKVKKQDREESETSLSSSKGVGGQKRQSPATEKGKGYREQMQMDRNKRQRTSNI